MSNDAIGIAILVTVVAVGSLLGLWLWYLPVSIAKKHRHKYLGPIAVITLFFGWTMLGWVVALAWACSEAQWAENDEYAGPIRSYNMFT